jgi:GntR family carbon starvation induced transcriptional regulator
MQISVQAEFKSGTMSALSRDDPSGESLVTNAVRRLRTAILTAELAPGARLRLDALQESFGISSSPLREALNRLASEGFIETEDRRGFRVRPVSVAECNDISRVRILLEREALRDAIAHGGDEWEAQVLAAYHRMRLAQGKLSGASMVLSDDWSSRHREFHFAMLGACSSRNLIELCTNYFVQAERYRHVTAPFRKTTANAAAEHLRIMKAVLARQEKSALDLLAAHIQRSTRTVVAALEAHPFVAGEKAREKMRDEPRRDLRA